VIWQPIEDALTPFRRVRSVTGASREAAAPSTYVESLDGRFSVRITTPSVGPKQSATPFPRLHIYEGGLVPRPDICLQAAHTCGYLECARICEGGHRYGRPADLWYDEYAGMDRPGPMSRRCSPIVWSSKRSAPRTTGQWHERCRDCSNLPVCRR